MFPPGTAVELATIGAARVLGMADSIGSIEVGKAADVILLDVDKPHLAPFTHPVHQIVYFATGADVDTVIVGGQVLMRNRVVSSVDVPRVLDDARTQQRLAFERVGIDHPADREGLWGSVRYLAGPTISL